MGATPAVGDLLPTTSLALPAVIDGQHLLVTFGLAGMVAIVFAETGLLLGFFLPGDSLLFAAGYAATGNLASSLHPSIVVVAALSSAVAVLGAQTGFQIGRTAGPALFERKGSRLFRRSFVTRAEGVVARYGTGRAIVLARFIPVVRTFLNPLMGAGDLPALVFLRWNILGGVLWGSGITVLGFFLGDVSVIGKNLELVAVAIVAISVLPIAIELVRVRRGPPAQR